VLLGEPVLSYLDILVVGMLVYQAFGRIGCFMAGCCHGRPSAWGVRYGQKHAVTGYLYFVQGARLFPVQILEALWLFFLTAGAIAISVGGGTAGENIAWYVVGYGTGRFVFEFLRGDTGRIVVMGFSEPQWTALLASSVVVALELLGGLPFHWWHAAAVGVMASVVATLIVRRRNRGALPGVSLFEEDRVRSTEDDILANAGLVRVTTRRGQFYVPGEQAYPGGSVRPTSG
jgi:prolipoprotein diacylglyceryltransferase